MKSKKILSILLAITVFTLIGTSWAFAAPGKGNGRGGMAPGQIKNHILNTDLSEEEAVELIIENGKLLPPGILKEIILGLDLSEDSLEELEEAGILNGLPGGILKEIYAGMDDDDDDDNNDDDDNDDDDNDEIEVKGYITGIDVDDKVIEIDNNEYQLPEEVEIEVDGEEADLEDLKVGMKVELEIEEEEAEIEAESVEGGDVKVEGNITALDFIGVYHIEIDEEEYKIAEEVEVLLDEKAAELEDLEVGMKAEVKIIEEEVVEIYAKSMANEVVEGEITALDLIGIYHIEIDDEEYSLSRNAQVVINGLSKTLEDLEIGITAVAKLHEDMVVKVIVEFDIEEIEGEITGIDVEDQYIAIDEVKYKLAEKVEIRLNNEVAALADLGVGMEINAVELNGEIVEVNAFKEEILEAQGKITAINLQERSITIDGVDYPLATGVIVKISGEAATLEDLIVGMTVEAELADGKILKIYAEIIETNKVEGEITGLDLIGIYHLSIDNQEYHLLREAIVTINEEEAELEDLQLGMTGIIYLVDNDIIKIEATQVDSKIVHGEIKDIDLIGIYHITVGTKAYEISEDLQVTIDGEEATLQELEINMEANILIENEVVIEIDAFTSEIVNEINRFFRRDLKKYNNQADTEVFWFSL
ncbi:hypothetical protein [Alkaliphilus serpentinus]|uniref:DUF5666 domain-containing protein n=1 Tax=Alkaliphilus serpentinus TaxID=1482731 RepID=A0A833HL24_9FIRM|nr:hypothetical protein [Alkaliphilus serpentinus]KAB3524891.1 hypothetical protein F8153_15620 [Alkaliphilus serpentinus]